MTNNEIDLAITACKWIKKWHETNEEYRNQFEIVDILQSEISQYLDYKEIISEWVKREKKENIKRDCPKCGSPLVERINKTTKAKFWGCSMWPKCNSNTSSRCGRVAYQDNIFWDDSHWDFYDDHEDGFDPIF